MHSNIIKKPFFILATIIVVAIPLFILLIAIFKNGQPIVKNSPLPTPTPSAQPSQPAKRGQINILRAFPIQDLTIYYLPTQPVEFLFDTNITPSEIQYSTTPTTLVKIRQGSSPASVIIYPVKNWVLGTTIINIKRQTSTNEGALGSDYIYTINTSLPPTYPPNMGDY